MSLKNIVENWGGNMIIGISGKSGSGKSSVSKDLSNKLNYKWVDVDKLSKKIREEYVEEIVTLVKDSSIVINDKIDSKKLGRLLFSDKKLMDKYNEFIYSKLVIMIENEIKENKNIVLDSIFLPIMEEFEKCDYTILVKCKEEIRRSRVMLRDNIDESYFKRRDRTDIVYDESKFDFVIDNDVEYKIQLEDIGNKLIING